MADAGADWSESEPAADGLALQRPIFSIGAVARMLDVAPATLRTWEDRYETITPTRTENGRRLFSREQVEWLRFVKARLDEGLQPADAHRLLEDRQRRVSAEGTPGSVGGEDEPAGEAAVSAVSGVSAAPGEWVMLVERDLYTADLVEYFLVRAGFAVDRVREAGDPEKRIAERSPRVVIVGLPRAGLNLIRSLKERGVECVIAISTLDQRTEATAAGAEAFLLKPLDFELLIDSINECLAAYLPAIADTA